MAHFTKVPNGGHVQIHHQTMVKLCRVRDALKEAGAKPAAYTQDAIIDAALDALELQKGKADEKD